MNGAIFRPTEEERAALADIDAQAREGAQKYATDLEIGEAFEAESNYYIQKVFGYLTSGAKLTAAYNDAVAEFQRKRREQLTDAAAILADAKEQARDFITYTAAHFYERLKKQGAGALSVVVDGEAEPGPGAWDFSEYVTGREKVRGVLLAERPQPARIRALLAWHLEQLNEKQRGDLLAYIEHVVKEHALIEHKTPKREKQPPIKNALLFNDKLNHELIKGDAGENAQRAADDTGEYFRVSVNQGKAASKRRTVTEALIIAPKIDGARVTCSYTAFDNAVLSAVAAVFHTRDDTDGGPVYLSSAEIWRLMNGGLPETKKPTPAALDRVRDSINKMRASFIVIDAEEEARRFKIDGEALAELNRDRYILQAEKVEGRTEKGRFFDLWKIYAPPPLYEYNRIKGHLLRVPLALLDTSEGLSAGENVIEFKNYLLLRVVNYKNRTLDSNRILFDSLYSSTGIKPPDARGVAVRKTAAADREKLAAILTVWQKRGFINSFAPLYSGQRIIGFEFSADRVAPAPGQKSSKK